LPVRKK